MSLLIALSRMVEAVATNLINKQVLIALAVDTDIDINILKALFLEKKSRKWSILWMNRMTQCL